MRSPAAATSAVAAAAVELAAEPELGQLFLSTFFSLALTSGKAIFYSMFCIFLIVFCVCVSNLNSNPMRNSPLKLTSDYPPHSAASGRGAWRRLKPGCDIFRKD